MNAKNLLKELDEDVQERKNYTFHLSLELMERFQQLFKDSGGRGQSQIIERLIEKFLEDLEK